MGKKHQGIIDNTVDKVVDKGIDISRKMMPFSRLIPKKLVEKSRATAKKQIKSGIKSRIRITLIKLVAVILLIAIIAWIIVSCTTNFYFNIIKATQAAGLFEAEDLITDDSDNGDMGGEETKLGYGVYPKDATLRQHKEMMEICDAAGKAFGIDGKFVFAVVAVESSFSVVLEHPNGSLYTDLCLNGTNAKDGNLFFVNGENTGKYQDKNGNPIVDPLKVGVIRPDYGNDGIARAIGPFQFWSSYITEAGRFDKLYINEQDKAGFKKVSFMSYYDPKLEFMRPNPFYFPDAALNCAYMISCEMGNHKSQLDDVSSLNLPENIKQEILFIYGADQYHGDTRAKGKGEVAQEFHNSFAELYASIYTEYKKKGIINDSLGEFSKTEFNSAKIRAIDGGVQFGGDDINFDGSYNHPSDVVKSDNMGKYVQLGGYKYYTPLITDVSNKAPFNTNYRQLLLDMHPNGGNKFGWVYGFQGLNAVTYCWGTWTKQIEAALKAENGTTGAAGTDNAVVISGNIAVSETNYPTANVSAWVTGKTPKLNQAFLGRIAELARSKGKKINISSGYRSAEYQAQLIKQYLAENPSWYIGKHGNVYDSSGHSRVAAPGRSRHQTGLAADINTKWLKQMGNNELKKFGLYKPMSYENWHVEPLETKR